MNLLRRSSLLEKVCRTIEYYSITTFSAARWKAGPLPESGLQTRFLNFLEHSDNPEDDDKSTFANKREFYLPTSLISATSVQNNLCTESLDKSNSPYETLIEFIRTELLFPTQSIAAPKTTLQLIDKQCCRVFGQLSQSQIFSLLHLLTKTIPNDVTSMKFYKNAVLTLRKMLELQRLSKREILQLLFFESWHQKLATRNAKLVMSFLPPLSELSLMEQSIVAQSAYQCSIGLNYEDVRVLQDAMEKNAELLVKDAAILSTLCKAVRRAGPTKDCSLNNLSRAIVNNDEKFNFMCAAHILSLYTEAGLECSEVLQKIFNDSMIIMTMNREKGLKTRIKDLDRLLWASSMMNYKLRDSDIKEISQFLDTRYDDLKKEPFYFANILLSLWILNWKSKRLVENFLKSGVYQPIVDDPKLWKPKARLHLLLSCIKIEAPEIEFPKELSESYKVGMKISSSVKRLQRIIDRLKETLEIDEIEIDCPVNGLYIAGVSFKHKQSNIHVDLLDETTCFKRTILPRGFLNLKLRLLPKIGVHSILITEAQLNDPESLSSMFEKCIQNNLYNETAS